MQTRYSDLIHQTFDFPQEEFEVKNTGLYFHGIDLMGLVKEHGSPLKFTYLIRQLMNKPIKANTSTVIVLSLPILHML
jgi:hypothetical protein